MDAKLFPTLGLLICVLAACGGKSFDTDNPQEGGSGGGNQAGSPTAGRSHGGTSGNGQGGTGGIGTGGSSGGAGSAGSGGECAAYDDAAPGFIPVEIINKTTSPIHLGQEMLSCGVEPLFDVAGEAGPLATEGSCRTSCSALRMGGPVGCPAFCASPSTLTLSPGEVYATNWNALYFAATELPAQCDVGYGRTCTQARSIAPGKFTFSAKGGSSIECSGAPNASCSPCQPMASGGCMTNNALIGGTVITADTEVVLDGSYGVYGTALPAPRPYDPGSGDAAPVRPGVQIIFGG